MMRKKNNTEKYPECPGRIHMTEQNNVYSPTILDSHRNPTIKCEFYASECLHACHVSMSSTQCSRFPRVRESVSSVILLSCYPFRFGCGSTGFPPASHGSWRFMALCQLLCVYQFGIENPFLSNRWEKLEYECEVLGTYFTNVESTV